MRYARSTTQFTVNLVNSTPTEITFLAPPPSEANPGSSTRLALGVRPIGGGDLTGGTVNVLDPAGGIMATGKLLPLDGSGYNPVYIDVQFPNKEGELTFTPEFLAQEL